MNNLKEWLKTSGFKIAPNQFSGELNECDWYAYRRSKIAARDCETNDGKAAQIIAYPSLFTLNGREHQSVAYELCGEANGMWWKLQAYGLSPDDAKRNLPAIEVSLVAAWNALIPAENSAQPERT